MLMVQGVNTGLHNGLGVLIREINPWLIVVHCFSHRFELAVKDTFKNTLYLYKKSSKRIW